MLCIYFDGSYQVFIIVFMIIIWQPDHMINQNMENHPGKPYNHKTYGSVLAE
jgi:hypothetical protein